MSVAAPSPPETPEHHQRVGWLELFYDLVFVVVIERLTHLLHDNPGAGRIWLTIGLTVVVWLAWFNVSAYTNMSGGIGARGRPFVFASMAGMGVLALGIEGMPEGDVRLFVIGYVIARLSIWPMWLHSARRARQGWSATLAVSPLLTLAWLGTLLLHGTGRLVTAFIVLAVLEMVASVARPEPGSQRRMHGPHMVERIGLLLMIVLGESVVQIVDSLDTERTAMHWFTAALAMALLCSLWWLIYEATMTKMEEAVEKDDASAVDFIGSSQLGIIAGLIMIAAGLADAVHTAHPEHGGSHLHSGSLACLCVGVLIVHVGVSSLTRRAFAVNLGLVQRRDEPMTREERDAERARLREQAKERERHVTPGRVVAGMLQNLTYLVPVIIVWIFGAHWPSWVVVTALFAYVVLTIWSQGLGERRIRDYLARQGQKPEGSSAGSPDDGVTT